MELTPEEQERKESIQCYMEGGHPVDIYRHINKSKKWFNKWLNRYQTGQKDWYTDLPRKHKLVHNKTDEKIELVKMLDKVGVEMSPYDLEKGRIVYRLK